MDRPRASAQSPEMMRIPLLSILHAHEGRGTKWLSLWWAFDVRVEVNPRDLWIGAYPPDPKRGIYQHLYLVIIPAFPIHIRWHRSINWRRPWDIRERSQWMDKQLVEGNFLAGQWSPKTNASQAESGRV